jgi:hypothetical protein
MAFVTKATAGSPRAVRTWPARTHRSATPPGR